MKRAATPPAADAVTAARAAAGRRPCSAADHAPAGAATAPRPGGGGAGRRPAVAALALSVSISTAAWLPLPARAQAGAPAQPGAPIPAGAPAPDHPAVPPAVQALRTETLASHCAACHGTAGRAVEGSVVPALAGRPAGELAGQMRAFKSGSRPATVMQQIAKGYTDPQIEQLAAYFAAQPGTQPK